VIELLRRFLKVDFSRTNPPALGSLDSTPTGRHRNGRPSCRDALPPPRYYLIWSYTLKSGRYIEITMNPTMLPMRMIITGSRIDVSALIAALTSSS
jgi:hypothetical protein